MKSNSKIIALSSVSTALAVVCLVIGAYFPVLDYSAIFMASLCMMLPLTKNSLKGSILCYISTSLLSLIFVGGRFEVVVPFIMFFGLHAIINYVVLEKRLNKILFLIIKDIWFVLTLVLIYILLKDFIVVEAEWAKQYIYYILIIGGGVVFIVYDYIFNKMQYSLNLIIKRLKI